MKLQIQRTQEISGFKGVVTFTIQAKAEYSPEEQHAIDKYKLGKEVLYESAKAAYYRQKAQAGFDAGEAGSGAGLFAGFKSATLSRMQLKITVNSLSEGERVDCKSLDEALEAEDAIKTACQNVKGFIEVAQTFNGEVETLEF